MNPPAELGQKLDLLARELNEAREQQAAISDILRVISNSPGEVKPVFDSLAEHAARICEAQIVDVMVVVEERRMRRVASVGDIGRFRGETVPLNRDTVMGRSVCDRQPVHVIDLQAADEFPLGQEIALRFGHRTTLAVPLIREDRALGTILVRRTVVRPFEDKHIALLKTFADQAAIAIENARLLNELRQRTGELAVSLEQQTATSEILASISGSMTDSKPVFDAIVRNLLRLFGTGLAMVQVLKDGMLHLEAASSSAEFEILKQAFPQPMDENSGAGRCMIAKQVLQFAPVSDDPAAPPLSRRMARALGFETVVFAPMMRGESVFGAIATARPGTTPFTEKEVELITTFADQAVIAIENTRLLNELSQRTDDLSESLEQQTATSEILSVISNSLSDTQPVFDAIVQSGLKLFPGALISVALRYGETINAAAVAAPDPARAEAWRRTINSRTPLARNYMHGAALLDRRIVDIPDVADAPAELAAGAQNFLTSGNRAITIMPMMRGDEAIGLLSVVRLVPGPLSDKQIAVLKTFASQAVIAIENTRLLNELRQRTDDLSESLEQQTATSEVLKVISSSPGSLQPVFEAMLENAVRICDAKFGSLYLSEGEMFRLVQTFGLPPQLDDELHRLGLRRPSPHMALGQLAQSKRTIQVADALAVLESAPVPAGFTGPTLAELAGARTLVVVPMLKDNALIGAIIVYRQEVRPFTDKQIELVKTFADQAVIAIENTRLLSEVRQQASQLEAQSQELRTLNQGLEQRVDEQVGEIERVGRLRRFLSPQVADLIVSSGAEKQLESHRREITALFCDLRGFTGFSETSDPEDVMALLREYHKAIGEIIFRHGGTLERFAGDGVMVIFNDPVPLPNPALAAVQMALELRAAIGALIEKWRRLGHDLGFGIGIAHGYATLGTIGFEGRFDYAAIGTVSNVASRLCDEAAPGQILVSPRVLLAVEDAVAVEPVREMSLKGIRRPMLVHNVVGANAQD